MNNLWKMEQLCKPEQIFDLLRTAEWPLGIVVFGADSEFNIAARYPMRKHWSKC